jgi:hypothetical protein
MTNDESFLDWFIPLKEYLEDCVLSAAEPLSPEYTGLSEAQAQWQRIIMSLDSELAWAGGRHEGDCTQEPMTCNRCLVEETRRDARHLFGIVKDLVIHGYPKMAERAT